MNFIHKTVPLKMLFHYEGSKRKIGLIGEYYNIHDKYFGPDLTRVDNTIDFDWSNICPDPKIAFDHFWIKWKGKFVPDFTGKAVLGFLCEDHLKVYINNKLYINTFERHRSESKLIILDLEKNVEYNILIEYRCIRKSKKGIIKFFYDNTLYKYRRNDLPIENRIEDLIMRMSLEEKIEQMHGLDFFSTKDNLRLGIPGFRFADCVHGVARPHGRATSFPVSIAMAATWDTELIKKVGRSIGKEIKAKGRNQGLGPCVDICRDPKAGRTQETFGEDPFLSSKMAVAYVKGMQTENVIATVKHFVLNSRENDRTINNYTIDEKSLREIYCFPFEKSVKESNVFSVMTSYNLINEEYASENYHLLTEILRDSWGFKGHIISDWGAIHNTLFSLEAGLDVESDGETHYGETLKQKVKDGEIKESEINERIKNILRSKFVMGFFEGHEPEDESLVNTKEHKKVALDSARRSIVLLKNQNNILPFDKKKVKTIAVIGPGVNRPQLGDMGSSAVFADNAVTLLEGVRNKAGNKIKILYSEGCSVLEEQESFFEEVRSTTIKEKALKRSGFETAKLIAKESDVVIFAATLDYTIEQESYDRDTIELPEIQNELIKELAKINKNIVVVLYGGSAIGVSKWIRDIPALLMAWYPGQEGGYAVADIIFGDVNPSGKLPITFPANDKQVPVFNNDHSMDIKIGVGYKYYENKNIEPMFCFGYGLSFTKFDYNKMSVDIDNDHLNIYVGIKNTGNIYGEEIIQVYIKYNDPVINKSQKSLKAFSKVELEPNSSKKVYIKIKKSDISYFDINKNGFIQITGKIEIMISSSFNQIKLKEEVIV